MSQSQGIEVRRPSRRTIATGAAWAVPVIAVGAAAPAMATSPNECRPQFQIVPDGSFKCCNGPVKNMKLTLRVVDTQNCLTGTSSVCIQSVRPTTPSGSVGRTVFVGGQCAVENGTILVFLQDVSNCTVNLTVTYTIDSGDPQIAFIQSANIPDGNADSQCLAPTPS